jgi:adenosylhomocysteine nucleosidase
MSSFNAEALEKSLQKAKNPLTCHAMIRHTLPRMIQKAKSRDEAKKIAETGKQLLEKYGKVNKYQNGNSDLEPTSDKSEIPVYCLKKKCGKVKKTKLDYEVGIISAFSPEIQQFEGAFSKEFAPVDIAGRRFYRGILDGKLVVITVSGISMTNAAQTTQLMIDYFDPKYLLFSGVAGGVNPANQIGDVIIAKRWAEYQNQKYIRTTYVDDDPNPPLQLDSFFDTGIDFPNIFFRIVPADNKVLAFTRPDCTGCSDHDPSANNIIDTNVDPPYLRATAFAIPTEVDTFKNGDDYMNFPFVPQQFYFWVDNYLLAAAQSAIAQGIAVKDICPDPNSCYTPNVKIGDLGVSGPTFVDNAIYRQDVFEQFLQGDATTEILDMESAAFAHVATSNRKPFIAVRSLSDLAGGDADANPILKFLEVAAENSVIVTRAILNQVETVPKKCHKLVTRAQLCD